MAIHTYVIEHDVGFAPNPFYGACTLAACKPRIRQRAKINDYVIGFGSAKHGYGGLLVYWMKVEEIIDFDEYWNSPLLRQKKPIMNGSFMRVYGDNIYHTKPDTREFAQSFSFHSKEDGSVDVPNLNRDTCRTTNVLISRNYLYLGREAKRLPTELRRLEKRGIGEDKHSDVGTVSEFEHWLAVNPERGYLGRPIDWPPVEKRRK